MKITRRGDDILVRLTTREATVLLAHAQAGRHPVCEEFGDRLTGSPRWKAAQRARGRWNGEIHEGVLPPADYNRILEEEHL